jgi:acetoin utilization protein AcuB
MNKNLVQMQLNECMTPRPLTAGPYATLAEALEIMQKNTVRRLPVVEDGDLIGIITLNDIYEAKPSDVRHSMSLDKIYERLSKLTVKVAMTENPITIYQADTIGHAAEVMMEEKIGGLPVVDANKKLVGLITESDIFRLIACEWREENTFNSAVGS